MNRTWSSQMVGRSAAFPRRRPAVLLSVGATRVAGRFTIDVGLQSVLFESLDTKGSGNTFESAYDSGALALAATASWTFGRH